MAKSPSADSHQPPAPSTPPPGEDTSNRVEMRIPPRAEWVRVVRLATAGVAARLGFSYDEVEDIKLAVAEACNNAILHGAPAHDSSPSQPQIENDATVTIRWTIFPDRLKISVTDQGRIPTEDLPLISAEENAELTELPEGGMGLILIQTLMDEVEHEAGPDSDTTLHLTKYAPPVSMTARRATDRRSAPAAAPRRAAPVNAASPVERKSPTLSDA